MAHNRPESTTTGEVDYAWSQFHPPQEFVPKSSEIRVKQTTNPDEATGKNIWEEKLGQPPAKPTTLAGLTDWDLFAASNKGGTTPIPLTTTTDAWEKLGQPPAERPQSRTITQFYNDEAEAEALLNQKGDNRPPLREVIKFADNSQTQVGEVLAELPPDELSVKDPWNNMPNTTSEEGVIANSADTAQNNGNKQSILSVDSSGSGKSNHQEVQTPKKENWFGQIKRGVEDFLYTASTVEHGYVDDNGIWHHSTEVLPASQNISSKAQSPDLEQPGSTVHPHKA